MLIACLCCAALAQQQTAPPFETGHVVNNVVFMSPGEKIGVNLAGAADGTAQSITEEPNPEKANLVLSFKQEKGMMLLTIQNRTKYWLTYEAGIRGSKARRTVQDERDACRTRVKQLRIGAGSS